MNTIFALLSWGLPIPVALAIVALLGYVVGLHRKSSVDTNRQRTDSGKAKTAIADLETISNQVRVGLATHHASIVQFKERLAELAKIDPSRSNQDLFAEAEKILAPTLQLANQIAQAYDEMRQQTNVLMTCSDVQSDPLTKLNHRDALDLQVKTQFAIFARYGNKFSVIIYGIDDGATNIAEPQGESGEQIMRQVALILGESVRETDMVARYSRTEFVLMLPETDLAGACCLAERLRGVIENQTSATVSSGVASAIDTDSPKTLISRADSALYSARTSGGNQVFQHSGRQILAISTTDLSAQLASVGGKR